MVPNVAFGPLPFGVTQLFAHGRICRSIVSTSSRHSINLDFGSTCIALVVSLWRQAADCDVLILETYLLAGQPSFLVFEGVIIAKDAIALCA